jgi:hypothetical protein
VPFLGRELRIGLRLEDRGRHVDPAIRLDRTAAATSIRRYGWTSGDSSPRAPRATSTSTYS